MKRSDANAMLMMLSMVTVLISVSYKIWRIASLRIDVEHQREIYYKRFYLADNILNEAVKISMKNFDSIFKSQKPVKLDVSRILGYGKSKNVEYNAFSQASVVLKKGKPLPNVLVVSVMLLKIAQPVPDRNVFSLKCWVKQRRGGANPEYIIANYFVG